MDIVALGTGAGFTVVGALGIKVTEWFFRKTVGTEHITIEQCRKCEMRHQTDVILSLLVLVAEKAGVPQGEVTTYLLQLRKKYNLDEEGH